MYFSGIFNNENISFPFPCSPVIRECSWKKPETEKKKKKKKIHNPKYSCIWYFFETEFFHLKIFLLVAVKLVADLFESF